MISRPLFSIVAESMVMRWPMTRWDASGPARGDIGEDFERSLAEGPPDAVSQICFTSAAVPTLMHWWMALLFRVNGQQRDVAFAGVAGKDLARRYHALFVGQPTGFSGRELRRGSLSRPATPTMAETTKSTSAWVAQATLPAVPQSTSTPVNAGGSQAAGKVQRPALRWQGKSIEVANGEPARRRLSDASCGQGCNGNNARVRLDDKRACLADGAGGTEDC